MHAMSCSHTSNKPARMKTATKRLPAKEPAGHLDELVEETRRLHASLARCRTIIARLAAGYGR